MSLEKLEPGDIVHSTQIVKDSEQPDLKVIKVGCLFVHVRAGMIKHTCVTKESCSFVRHEQFYPEEEEEE